MVRSTSTRLFVDCDGVLADFDRGALSVLGMAAKDYDEKFGKGAIWLRLRNQPKFFETLYLMEGATELFAAVQHLKPTILTGLPPGSWAEPQKRAWAGRHFPGLTLIATRPADKHAHCRRGDVLVEDSDKHRGLWEAKGGLFIHHRNTRDTLTELRRVGVLETHASSSGPP
jgi:hypothetical protein